MKKKTYRMLLIIEIVFFSLSFVSCTAFEKNTYEIIPLDSDMAVDGQGINFQDELLDENLMVNILEEEPKGYVGYWQWGAGIGAGYGERFAFHEDGSFWWAKSQSMTGERLIAGKGIWTYVDGTMEMTTTAEYYITGGKMVAAPYSYDGKMIEGGMVVQVNQQKVDRYQASGMMLSAYGQKFFMLEDKDFYNYDNQPDFFDTGLYSGVGVTAVYEEPFNPYCIYYILPNSHNETIVERDLYFLDKYTVRLAKNEIYARKGYIFQDQSLHEYFTNMPWYKENPGMQGTFEELNEIERKNVMILNEFIESGFYQAKLDNHEEVFRNGQLFYMQKATQDLDGDGYDEDITVYFNGYAYEIEVQDTNGRTHYYKGESSVVFDTLYIGEFDINDGLIQFYLTGVGPSNGRETQIFSFDDGNIYKNISLPGYITRFDGLGKLYSFEEYNVNCYYCLYNGLTPLPKENIVGSYITRGNIELFEKPGTGVTAVITAERFTDPDYMYEGKYQDQYLGVVKEATPLLVTDIEFLPWLDEAIYFVPWIKVKTPDNVEGWFCLYYGP